MFLSFKYTQKKCKQFNVIHSNISVKYLKVIYKITTNATGLYNQKIFDDS